MPYFKYLDWVNEFLPEGTPAELRKRFAFYYEVIDLEEGKVYKVREDEVKEFVAKLRGKFEVRAPSLEEVYLEVMKGA